MPYQRVGQAGEGDDAVAGLSTPPPLAAVTDAVLLQARILIVDDMPANVKLLERLLGSAGYPNVSSTTDPRTVCALHAAHRFDLIVLDMQMPGMDGFEVMEGLKALERDGYLPVLVITAQPGHKLRALREGARDFVSKPFDVAEVLTRVRNLLEVRLLHAELGRRNAELKVLFDEVVAERKLSERLALHVPPQSIASPLPARPDVTAESVAQASVLIADIVGLASLAPAARPDELALLVDELFAEFDVLVAAHGMRKVKTLGNSYMAVAGVTERSGDHARHATRMALEMMRAMERFDERRGQALQLRIGVATGPVVAGMIGRRGYLYDIWGDTVNVAARMESHGVAGRVQVTDQTRALLGESFRCAPRGALTVEGLGEVVTWFVEAVGGRPLPAPAAVPASV
ncbi:MAG: response regulator [Proteobacteria bacterium]|nr:response regulator [Pseudomonadota bacterium]